MQPLLQSQLPDTENLKVTMLKFGSSLKTSQKFQAPPSSKGGRPFTVHSINQHQGSFTGRSLPARSTVPETNQEAPPTLTTFNKSSSMGFTSFLMISRSLSYLLCQFLPNTISLIPATYNPTMDSFHQGKRPGHHQHLHLIVKPLDRTGPSPQSNTTPAPLLHQDTAGHLPFSPHLTAMGLNWGPAVADGRTLCSPRAWPSPLQPVTSSGT